MDNVYWSSTRAFILIVVVVVVIVVAFSMVVTLKLMCVYACVCVAFSCRNNSRRGNIKLVLWLMYVLYDDGLVVVINACEAEEYESIREALII